MAEVKGKAKGRPLIPQFSIRTLLGLMTATGLLFGTLRWLNVPSRASWLVLLVALAGGLAAVVLVAVIAGQGSGEDKHE